MKLSVPALELSHFLVFIFASYAMVVSVFLDAGLRNYLVLLAAMLGGVMFLTFGLALKRQAFFALILFAVMAARALSVGGFGETGSVALTFVYALGFFAIAAMLDRVADKRALIKALLRWLILAFAILSVVQMVTSLAGLPVPNLIASKGLWSYNSFAIEPSQLGRTVGITMLSYLMLVRLPVLPGRQAETRRNRLRTVAAFLTTMFLSGSALAAIAIIAVYLLSRSVAGVVAVLVVAFLVWPVILLVDFEPLQRAVLLLSNIGTLDTVALLEADASGASRIMPAVIYLQEAVPSEAGFWFGYGSGELARFFQGRIPGFGDTVPAGFIPGFAVVYGVILTGVFLWLFAFRQLNRTTAPLIAFWLVFFINSAWNTQVFWYGLIVIQVAWIVSRDNARQVRAHRLAQQMSA